MMIEKLSVLDFESIFFLMEQSFPKEEFKTKQEQYESFTNPYYHVYGLKDDTIGLVGFIALWDFDDFVYLEHFAVDPSKRNGGYGKQLMSYVLNLYASKLICLEVEPPLDEIKTRRIQYYQRLGFYLYDQVFTQPALSKGYPCTELMTMTYKKEVSIDQIEKIHKVLQSYIYIY